LDGEHSGLEFYHNHNKERLKIRSIVMGKFWNKKDVQLSLVLAFLGAIAGLSLAVMQWVQMDEAMRDATISQLGSREIMFVVGSIQVLVPVLLTAFLGIKILRLTGFHLNWIPEGKAWLHILVVASASALIISLGDRILFKSFLPESVLEFSFSLTYLISSVFYGGIVEEVYMRLFLMSLIVLVMKKLYVKQYEINKDDNRSAIPSWIYILANILTAVIFGAGHLPATAQMFGLSPVIVIRAFVLNGFAGIGFGYLYWKHGIGSAIYAHILTHLLIQLLILPLVA